MYNTLIAAASLAVLVTGCTVTCPAPPAAAAPVALQAAPALQPAPAPPPAPPPPAPPPSGDHAHARQEHGPRHLHRFDFVVSGGAEKTGSSSGTYSMVLEEERPGEVHAGANVPLGQNGGGARQDVGLKIKARYEMVGEDLVLDVDTEQSALDDGGVIRKLTARGAGVVTPGKPSTLISVDDAAGKKRLQVSVTVTKVR